MSPRGPERRRAAIESLMSGRAEVEIADLAVHFGVSEMTIRRDLEALEVDGRVRRLVGGRAVVADPKSREPALSARSHSDHEAKAHIGRAAADLIADNEVIFFDGGSTALAVAYALIGTNKPLTVLTRSLLVATAFAHEPNVEIYVLGGRLKTSEMSTTTMTITDDLKHYNVDTYVLGISGVHPTRGLTDYDPDESVGKRLAMERADRVILVFDHSKIGRVLMSRVAGIDDVNVVVTDADPKSDAISAISPSVTLVLVPQTPDATRVG